MTAPSEDHGMVFARGDFEYSLYLALARGQKQKGGKSAFGLKIGVPDFLARTPVSVFPLRESLPQRSSDAVSGWADISAVLHD